MYRLPTQKSKASKSVHLFSITTSAARMDSLGLVTTPGAWDQKPGNLENFYSAAHKTRFTFFGMWQSVGFLTFNLYQLR